MGSSILFSLYVYHQKQSISHIYAAQRIDHNFIPPSLRNQFNFVADVVEQVEKCVVHIELVQRISNVGQPMPLSNGSGFVVQDNGLVLTNAHVVTGRPGARIIVTFPDGSKCNAVLEDLDTESDLAILKCETKSKIFPIKLGRSSDIRNGEFVIAMGSPLTLNNTNTFGIVSNKQRSSDSLGLRNKRQTMNYIQTDAAITFGNSGGPLVNLDGEVIGINSMHVTAGISFAIPIDYAIEFLHAYERRDKTERKIRERKYIGITMLTLNGKIIDQLRRERHLPHDLVEGVMIFKVIYNSPAYLAGLQPEDIIVELNGKPCTNAKCIYDALEDPVDNPLELVIIRHHAKYRIKVTPQRT